LEELEAHIDPALERLGRALIAGIYRPGKLRGSFITKADGGSRALRIPAVIDRVAQTAALIVLEPEMDRRMSEASWGYRRRRSVADAIRVIEDAYAAGLVWTVDADIERFFENVRHRQLLADLAMWIEDERILRLISMWLRSFNWRGLGIAQGAPISPLLANVYLHPLDRLVTSHGHRIVRYADDFVVLTATRREAKAAQKQVGRVLDARGLRLSRTKTKIMLPGTPYRFLGQTLCAPAGNIGTRATRANRDHAGSHPQSSISDCTLTHCSKVSAGSPAILPPI
jgi:group II intron reverse transcriptase/maturase